MPNTPTIPNFPPQGIQAQLDLLYLYNPDAANKLIEQLEAGLIKIEELQKEIEKALQDMQGVLRYKGSVQTEADLPTEGNVIGDVWNIISTDENVAWTGTEWDKFGSTIDTSEFLTKTDAATTYIPQANINTNTQYQSGSAYVPSSNAFRAFLRAPTYYNSNSLMPTATNPAIIIEGAQSYSNNLQDCIIVISDNSGYNTSGKACGIRITTLGYNDGGGVANQPYVRNAQLLFNTLGEDLVFYGTVGAGGTLVITPRGEVWQKTNYSVRILRLTTNNSDGDMRALNVHTGKRTSYTTFEITPQMPADEAWAKDNFINSDASTYTLATLQDAFNYSAARLYKIFNEDKMPTKNTFTLFSLGWTYNDTNNMPTLLASDLQTGKFYFYHGNYENCSPTTWQEFTFGGDALAQEVETNKNDLADLGDQVHDIEAKIPENASATNQLATKADIPSGSGLPDQTGHTGFLQTDGTNATWSDKEALVNNGVASSSAIGNIAIGDGAGAGSVGTSSSGNIALGPSAAAGRYSGRTYKNAIAIGDRAIVQANNAVLIGGKGNNLFSFNQDANTFKFANANGVFEIISADGTIPSERLAADGTTGQVLSKTDTGMQWVDMGGGSGTNLPDQSNHGGEFLTTDGTTASWGTTVKEISVGDSTPITLATTSAGSGTLSAYSGLGGFKFKCGISNTYFAPISTANKLGLPENPWAMVYAQNLYNGGTIAIPTTGGTMALVEDLQAVTAAAHLANGVKGDYCSTYAVIKAPNGRPKIKAGATNTVTIPAGMVFDCPLSTDPNDTSTGLITWATQEDVEITETTTDCFLVYVHALGEFKVCNKICFTPAQPEEGTESCMMWFNGEYWQLKSDDTGNVWRKTRAHPVCKCIFTNGVLTRLNYIGWYDIAPTEE